MSVKVKCLGCGGTGSVVTAMGMSDPPVPVSFGPCRECSGSGLVPIGKGPW